MSSSVPGVEWGAAEPPRAQVRGVGINVPTLAEAVRSIMVAATRGQPFTCLTLNLDHLVKLRTSAAFRKAYQDARFVTADGAPVAALARRQWPSVERTTGADMLVPLCQAAAEAGVPVYLFGTSDEVLAGAAAKLSAQAGGRLIIAGMEAPAQGFDPEGADAGAVIERIRASGARLCFVLLGAPKQEIFATRAVEAGVGCGFICAGAAADFIVGHQQRAPKAMQRLGLEWLYRLATNPRRLAGRYANCALLLTGIMLEEVTRPKRTTPAR